MLSARQLSRYQHVRISFLANNGTLPRRSGLNWGQRLQRERNQAYIRVPALIYHTNFFPRRRLGFRITTDDGHIFVGSMAQENSKAIHTPNNNSLFGIYFRNRIGVPLGNLITLHDLQTYGRTHIDIYKMSNFSFYFDFHV